MYLDLSALAANQNQHEEIEKAALRLLVQALVNYGDEASDIFSKESDNAADIGEDVTQEAIGDLGLSKINQRLYGKVDFKRACYLFLPDFSVRIALFIDSKAEKTGGTARLQMSQLSMTVMRQDSAGNPVTEEGKLPKILSLAGEDYLTCTMFVKYVYSDLPSGFRQLKRIIVAALPNGMLQSRYNPNHTDTIFAAGPHSPLGGEEFRTRLSFKQLRKKAQWRVQEIVPTTPFVWVP